MIQQTTWKRFGELLDNRFSKGVFTTEDSVRYTFFASVLECESLEPEDIILESPHPSRDRAEIDTWIPFISGDQVAIEFKYDREIPSGGNAPRTQKAGKIFHDIDRLGELGDGVRKVFVYLASAEMTRYFMKERNGLHSFFMLNVGESLRIDDRFMLGRSPTFIAAVGKTIDVDVDLIYTRNLSHGHAVRAYEVRAIEAIKKKGPATRKIMRMPLKDFNETFENELHDPEFAAQFVQAALDDSYETGDIGIFLVALRDVAQANRAMARTARHARVARPSLYKTLSEGGKPEFETIFALMPKMGFRFTVTPVQKQKIQAHGRRKRKDAPSDGSNLTEGLVPV